MVAPYAKTVLLFGVVIALFVAIGGVLGQFVFGSLFGGLIVALALAAAMNTISYFLCNRFVLWSTRAKIVTRQEAPRLAAIVDEIAPQFGLEAPRLAIVPSTQPNAFATGRDSRHAVVAATEGLLRMCDDRELRAVLAHELAHVKDRDILLMTFAATIAGAISYLSQAFLFSEMFGGGSGGGNRGGNGFLLALVAAITAPIAALLLQLAISRSRELRADEVGATTIRDPGALADALLKIDRGVVRNPQPLGTPAGQALCIANPSHGGFRSLFSTHPPMELRIRKLRAMTPDFRYRPTMPGRSLIRGPGPLPR